MYALGTIQVLIQIFFAVHAAKTGRYYWIVIIVIAPVIGSLVYFFVEYLPEKRPAARVKIPVSDFQSKSIRQLKKELEITDSVKNRMNLAKAYFHSGQYTEAISLLEDSLAGAHADDINVIEGLCHAYSHAGDFENLFKYLEKFEQIAGKTLPPDLRMLKAKAHESTGDTEAALKEYAAASDTYSGEEARCRHALLLKKKGETEKANEIFHKILKNAKILSKQYSKSEKEWIDIAKAEITD